MGSAMNGVAARGVRPAAAADAVPPYRTGLAEAMLERIAQTGPISGAEALKQLRSAFPDTPLAARVAALNLLARRDFGG